MIDWSIDRVAVDGVVRGAHDSMLLGHRGREREDQLGRSCVQAAADAAMMMMQW